MRYIEDIIHVLQLVKFIVSQPPASPQSASLPENNSFFHPKVRVSLKYARGRDVGMKTENLVRIQITKPITPKEVREFEKFEISGKLFDKKPPMMFTNFDYTAEYIRNAPYNDNDYWALEGWMTQDIIEDEEITQSYRDTYNPSPYFMGGSNTNSHDIAHDINALLKAKNGFILGYKSPEKMKGQRVRAPSRRAAPKKCTPAVKVNVRKMF